MQCLVCVMALLVAYNDRGSRYKYNALPEEPFVEHHIRSRKPILSYYYLRTSRWSWCVYVTPGFSRILLLRCKSLSHGYSGKNTYAERLHLQTNVVILEYKGKCNMYRVFQKHVPSLTLYKKCFNRRKDLIYTS